MRAFLRVSAEGAAGGGEAAGVALGVAGGVLGGAGDCVDTGDGSDLCAAGAAGVAAGEVAGGLAASGGACARTGPKAARLETSKMRETHGPCVMTPFSARRRSIPR
jgi:hypothetical protein